MNFLTMMLVWVSIASYNAFVLGKCGAKFGCLGSVTFVAFFVSIGAIISEVSFWAAIALDWKLHNELLPKYKIMASIASGLICSIGYFFLVASLSTIGIAPSVFVWILISLGVNWMLVRYVRNILGFI